MKIETDKLENGRIRPQKIFFKTFLETTFFQRYEFKKRKKSDTW